MFSLKPNRFQGQYKCLANLQKPVTIRLKVFIVLSICNFLVQTVINNITCMKSYLSYAFDFLSLGVRLLESEHQSNSFIDIRILDKLFLLFFGIKKSKELDREDTVQEPDQFLSPLSQLSLFLDVPGEDMKRSSTETPIATLLIGFCSLWGKKSKGNILGCQNH